jgi:hypothetical protein
MPKKAAKPHKAKAKPRKRAVARIHQNGDGFMDIMKGVNNFLKQSKIISTLAPALSMIPGVGSVLAPTVGGVAGALGYGKKHRKKAPKKKGHGLNPSGMGMCGKGLNLAGQRIPYR